MGMHGDCGEKVQVFLWGRKNEIFCVGNAWGRPHANFCVWGPSPHKFYLCGADLRGSVIQGCNIEHNFCNMKCNTVGELVAARE